MTLGSTKASYNSLVHATMISLLMKWRNHGIVWWKNWRINDATAEQNTQQFNACVINGWRAAEDYSNFK